jgi:hypothetical protein
MPPGAAATLQFTADFRETVANDNLSHLALEFALFCGVAAGILSFALAG